MEVIFLSNLRTSYIQWTRPFANDADWTPSHDKDGRLIAGRWNDTYRESNVDKMNSYKDIALTHVFVGSELVSHNGLRQPNPTAHRQLR